MTTFDKLMLAIISFAIACLTAMVLFTGGARADDVPACLSPKFLEDSINASVPSVKWGDMNAAETQDLLVKINANLLPEDAIIADMAVIGYAPGKTTVLIGLFKSGCMVKITYMEAGAFINAYPTVI